jgi:hypothetical protein
LVRASGKLPKRGLTEIHDVEQEAVRAVRVLVRRTVVRGEVVMIRRGNWRGKKATAGARRSW